MDNNLLLLRANLLVLLQEPNMEGHEEWSAPHVTDMQAATSHVHSGDVTDAAAIRVEEEEQDDDVNEEEPKRQNRKTQMERNEVGLD